MAVTASDLMIHTGDGCKAQTVKAGHLGAKALGAGTFVDPNTYQGHEMHEGSEPLTVVIAHFNVPHNDHPAPVVGNQGDAFDFTPLPPSDCPRLR